MVRQGRQALVLVPEIALTPVTADRFRSRFGNRVALLHSGLSPGERLDQWRRIKCGLADIVVGARSAVFAPLSRLSLIVVDEEHDASYKQQDEPRYHARDVALTRGEMLGITVLLGSATPSYESIHRAKEGTYRLFRLPERVEARALPWMTLIDMREERARREARNPSSPPFGSFESLGLLGHHGDSIDSTDSIDPTDVGKRGMGGFEVRRAGEPLIFSRRLADAIKETLTKGEQVLLFINRRATPGYCSAASVVSPCGVRIAVSRLSTMRWIPRCAATTAIIENGRRGVVLSAAGLRVDGSDTGRSRSKPPLDSSPRMHPSSGWIATPPGNGAHTSRSSRASSRGARRFLSGRRWSGKDMTFPASR